MENYMGGISAILSVLALAGFLAFLIGVGTVVLGASQGRPVRSGILLAAVGLVAGLIFSVISQGIVIVQPGEVAVVFNTLTGDLEEPRQPGTHIVVPVVNTFTIYPTVQQNYDMGDSQAGQSQNDAPVQARTQDGQEISLDVSILYGISPLDVNTVHRRWRDRYETDFVRPTARSMVRDVVSGFRAVEIYGEARGEMEARMQEAMGQRMSEEGLTLTDLLVRDITFSPEFAASIERAQIAEQDAQQARFRVQQRIQEAEQARAVAQGERDAAIARAEGEAQSIILRAQAEAESLRLVSEQIAANPALIQYQYIQRLADNINLALVPSNSPFLFDFESLAGNPDFVAPQVPDSSLDLASPALTPVPELEVTPEAGN
jgi:regulator of protease activity HflC (stomatin/prohibitin superfamily)